MEEVRRIKDAEIEKYKKYLNKAKKIIEGFGEGKSRAAEDSLEVCTHYHGIVEPKSFLFVLHRFRT